MKHTNIQNVMNKITEVRYEMTCYEDDRIIPTELKAELLNIYNRLGVLKVELKTLAEKIDGEETHY